MLILVNTDHNVLGQEGLADRVQGDVSKVLGQFGAYVTRLTVHLSDELSGKKRGDAKKCVMEAHLAGRKPLAVDHNGATVKASYDGAARKLLRLLRSTTERQKGRSSIRTVGRRKPDAAE